MKEIISGYTIVSNDSDSYKQFSYYNSKICDRYSPPLERLRVPDDFLFIRLYSQPPPCIIRLEVAPYVFPVLCRSTKREDREKNGAGAPRRTVTVQLSHSAMPSLSSLVGSRTALAAAVCFLFVRLCRPSGIGRCPKKEYMAGFDTTKVDDFRKNVLYSIALRLPKFNNQAVLLYF